LYWSEPAANGGTPVFDYVIQVSSRPDSSTAWPVFTTLTKPESAARSFSLAATNGHEYRFRVGALNGLGVGAWSNVTDIVTPTSFAAPSNLTATAYNASALINWSTPGSIPSGVVITQYAVRWSIDDGQTWLPSRNGILTGSVTTAKTILNLQNNIPYVFSVRGIAANTAGIWSIPSTQVIPLSSSPPAPINSANYAGAANWNATTNGNLLSVGTSGSTSAYGLYDMNGNVNEWLETRSVEASSSADAYTPGGAFTDVLLDKLASTGFISSGSGLNTQQYLSVTAKTPTCGFRLVSFETSPVILHSNIFMDVGDIGNSNAASNGFLFRSFGAVAYAYKIQKYEVSNAEYVDFLNNVDPTGANTLGLYDANMASNVHGGIVYNAAGSAGARYEIRQNMAAKPVNFVSWYSAIRYANWLHNGRTGPGTTENGSYQFSSAFPTGDDTPAGDFTNYAATPENDGSDSDLTLVRKTGAKYVLPTTHEWFKAAFYKGGGTQAGYWEYATRSNTPPSAVTATATGDGVL
jgi:formylglycine-generating enzyme required for sulfatase activity